MNNKQPKREDLIEILSIDPIQTTRYTQINIIYKDKEIEVGYEKTKLYYFFEKERDSFYFYECNVRDGILEKDEINPEDYFGEDYDDVMESLYEHLETEILS